MVVTRARAALAASADIHQTQAANNAGREPGSIQLTGASKVDPIIIDDLVEHVPRAQISPFEQFLRDPTNASEWTHGTHFSDSSQKLDVSIKQKTKKRWGVGQRREKKILGRFEQEKSKAEATLPSVNRMVLQLPLPALSMGNCQLRANTALDTTLDEILKFPRQQMEWEKVSELVPRGQTDKHGEHGAQLTQRTAHAQSSSRACALMASSSQAMQIAGSGGGLLALSAGPPYGMVSINAHKVFEASNVLITSQQLPCKAPSYVTAGTGTIRGAVSMSEYQSIPMKKLDALQAILGHTFANRSLLYDLTPHFFQRPSTTEHKSTASILSRMGTSAHMLAFCEKNRNVRPTELCQLRAKAIRNDSLARVAKMAGLDDFAIGTGDKATKRMLMALIGATYVDAGFQLPIAVTVMERLGLL
jgi:hypothetical protein